jgi:anaerobic selenocysteine-containing dehydrogenase
LYDQEFVREWTTGFEELAAHVAGCTPAWAAAITGVAARDIEAAARRYATEKPGVIEWGVALEQNPNCLQNVRAVALLRGLTGNLDIPGGDLLAANRLRPYPVLREALSSEALAKRLGAKDYQLLGGRRAFMPSAHIPGVFRAMRTGDPYRIRAFLMIGNNPLLTVANAREVRESMLRTELIVASELFMTPSAALADYVLPAAYWPEVNQVVELPYVMETGVVAQQRVAQVGECRQDEEVMIDLAHRMGLPGGAQSLEEILDYRLEPLGLTFAQLKQRHLVQPPQEYRTFERAGFRTPSRKVELFCKGLQRLGYDPLPTHHEPPESPVSTPEVAREFPYILTTGSRRREFFHSEHRQISSLRKRRPDPLAELHSLVVARHGIASGDWVWVVSPRGRIRMKALVTADIREDVVNVDHGWWFPERDGPEFGVWDSNANLLTANTPPYDPAFGSYQLRALLCRLEQAQEGGVDDTG